MDYILSHWVQIAAAAWLLEQALRAVSELTPWKFDDNIVKYLSKIIQAIFPKRNK